MPLSGVQDRHDPVCRGVDDENLVADQNEAIGTPVRIDLDHGRRQRVQGHAARDYGTDRDVEVHVGRRTHVRLPDGGRNLRALFGGQSRTTGASGSTLTGGRILGLRIDAILRLVTRLRALIGRLIALRAIVTRIFLPRLLRIEIAGDTASFDFSATDDAVARIPGTVFAGPGKALLVATGAGALRLELVQPEGGRETSGPQFLGTNAGLLGVRLG